jgi:hypothetical protein
MAKNQLVSPLIEYMSSEGMITDVTTPISSSVKQVQLTFATSGIYGLQIWKPYYFNPDATLDGSAIKGIQALTRTEVDPLPDGSQTLSSADVYAKLLLWLVDSGGDVLANLPLSELIASSSNTIATAFPKIQRFSLKDIVWQKCYVTIHDTVGIVAGESLLFNIYYDKD